MKFAANISTLFQNIESLIERLHLLTKRTDFIFDAIECQNPYVHSLNEWKSNLDSIEKERGKPIDFVLINSPPVFDHFNYIPNENELKKKILDKTLEYALPLKVKKVHLIMCDSKNEKDREKIIGLLKYSAKIFADHDIKCLIEPLSIRPDYYLRSYSLADQLSKNDNVHVMLDLFHLQRLHGNLTHYIEKIAPKCGHVQISQCPLRDSPNNEGEINYDYCLKSLAKYYNDYIGLEYNGKSSESFEWLNKYSNI